MGFDLNTLPFCNAKTRSTGKPCKRRGNLVNGRCRLHGGKSSGPKTEAGKIASRSNSRIIPSDAFMLRAARTEYVYRAEYAFNELIAMLLEADKPNWREVYKVIEDHRIPLEIMKYQISDQYGEFFFFFVQSCLDNYYTSKNSEHLKFTKHEPIITPKRLTDLDNGFNHIRATYDALEKRNERKTLKRTKLNDGYFDFIF